MSFSKKLLSGVLSIGLFSSMYPTKALDQLYFCELNKSYDIIMPQGSNKINFRKLPALYKYLQSLFFLVVENDENGDDIEGLHVLRSYIQLMAVQMQGRDMVEMYNYGYDVFFHLICSISYAIDIIINESLHDHKTSAIYLKRVLEMYRKIDENTSMLKNFRIHEIYSSMKKYMFFRCLYYCSSSPSDLTLYRTLLDTGHCLPLYVDESFCCFYRKNAMNIAAHCSSIERRYAACPFLTWYCGRSAVDFISRQARDWSPPIIIEYTQPEVTVEDDVDGSYAKMLIGKDPDENLPLFPNSEES